MTDAESVLSVMIGLICGVRCDPLLQYTNEVELGQNLVCLGSLEIV